MMLLFLAYRAILAEPRTKAAAPEDYSGGAARSEYISAADSMNQYSLPLGKQWFDIQIHRFFSLFMEISSTFRSSRWQC